MIEFAHTYKVYPGPVHALNNINLKINKGDCIFLTGPSGAGKTTLFKLLSAYDKCTSGSVKVMGQRLDELSRDKIQLFRRHIGVIYQDFKLLLNKNIFENVSLPLEIRNERKKQVEHRVHQVLDLVGIGHKWKDFPEQLSGGEQQRVSIARAIVHHPGLLIADEPTGNLDTELANDIISILKKINAQGTTLFIATHDKEIIQAHAEKVLEIKEGHITRFKK